MQGYQIPRVATELSKIDHWGTVGARTGFTRNNYKITPGLYCTGSPDANSPVLVTANYKLSFDSLRRELGGIHTLILVLDTRGINVWCAAGKGTFSADEIAYQVQQSDLKNIVTHRELTLPQLSANGVALHKLKNLCGFTGKFGPIKALDLPDFLQSNCVTEEMRTITFTLRERGVLIPLEICMLWKQLLLAGILFFLFSGFSKDIYSLQLAFDRAPVLFWSTCIAIFSGALLTPLLLPWIPFRQFWLKGGIVGLLSGALYLFWAHSQVTILETIGILLWIIACSSYLAMNFTGSTVFTSLSGVKKEMVKGLAFQITAIGFSLLLWLSGPFFY